MDRKTRFQVKSKSHAERELERLPRRYQDKVLSLLLILAENPYAGKKLEGEYKDCYALRIWPYRIIYQVFPKKLLVVVTKIGHRQGVYR